MLKLKTEGKLVLNVKKKEAFLVERRARCLVRTPYGIELRIHLETRNRTLPHPVRVGICPNDPAENVAAQKITFLTLHTHIRYPPPTASSDRSV